MYIDFYPDNVPPQDVNPAAYDDEGNLMPGFELDEFGNPVYVGANGTTQTIYSPAPVNDFKEGSGYPKVSRDEEGNLLPGWAYSNELGDYYVGSDYVDAGTAALAADSRAAAETKAKLQSAQAQATIQQRYNQATAGDWRVRIRLQPGATYLYNAENPGILKPLKDQGGVIFPYTPSITTSYAANYDKYDLVHSNYRGYFYKNSHVGEIQITATFTAQDTKEAEYLLAVIHFFRSVTKMFYGKDPQRGSPPPVVNLSGYGENQFNAHTCLVSSFNYSLPNDVDYIRIDPLNIGLNMDQRQPLQSSTPLGSLSAVINRLKNASLPKGATTGRVDLGAVDETVYGTGKSTYVPTKMEIQLTLLPIQSRQQISQQFSLENFAKGNLLRGGFW